jgi:hypothetical protein
LIDGWTVSNISMTLTNGGTAIYMTSYPRSRLPEGGIAPYPDEGPPGLVRNINVSNVSAQADGCVFLSGMEEKPLEQITLENVRIRMRGSRTKEWHANPPYPFRVWGHRFAPYDVYCRYVQDLKLRNVQIVWEEPEKAEWASAIRCRGVRGLEIEGFTGRQARGSGAAAIRLIDTENVYIHGSRPAEGAGEFVSLEGRTRNVAVMNNDLANAKQVARLDPGIAPGELFENGNRKAGGT